MRKGWGRSVGLAMVLASSAVAVASCKSKVSGAPGGLGQPCVPVDEYSTSFSGFNPYEVSIGTGNPACGEDGLCLINHFQGRVSCPYGQTQDDIESLPGDDPSRCAVPNTSGAGTGEAIVVPVGPQLADRRPKDAVYCSCRCANASGTAGSGDCTCPSGYSCAPLVEDIGLGSELAGSYCIKSGTAWAPRQANDPRCDINTENCGDSRPGFAVPEPDPDETTTNQFFERILQDPAKKVDLLFMIDNSISMADKQELLAQAVPQLLARLISPLCEDETGNLFAQVDGVCPPGTTGEFRPVSDIHLGVVSSSLGGHGGTLCSPEMEDAFDPEQNERGELIAPLRGVSSYDALGFLKWDPTAKYDPPGEADPQALAEAFTELVRATGETGCGYEAGLESWYRFLIDPQPPIGVARVGDESVPGEVNAALLEQRAWFLRPDSLVGIVMFSDENDCSIRDDGASWLVGTHTDRIARGTVDCQNNPNDPCCRSCALQEMEPPFGCDDLESDPNCALPTYTATEDSPNLRCYDQKRRFGIDLLYPWQRYVHGLQFRTVVGRDCSSDDDCPGYEDTSGTQVVAAGDCVSGSCEYVNPLYASNPYYPTRVPRRFPSYVFLAGIVGVPWQDLATEASLEDPDVLEYLGYVPTTTVPGLPDDAEPTPADRWDVIVGEPDTDTLPLDPFMIESVTPRDGLGLTNPIVGVSPQPTTAAVPTVAGGNTDMFNGHEYSIPEGDDLQYACIFALDTPRDCAAATGGCDCKGADADTAADRPLCQEPGTSDSGTMQYFAKAYPGIRYLKVLKEYGENSIVASVCPKITDQDRSGDEGYGYNPAMKVIISRLKRGGLRDACLPRSLPSSDDGNLACQLVEATDRALGISCDSPGRGEVAPALADAVRQRLERDYVACGDDEGQIACSDIALCTIEPAADQAACQNIPEENLGEAPQPVAGYCYIDAMQDRDDDGLVRCEVQGDPDCIGNPQLVAGCEASNRRRLRIVSVGVEPEVPYPASTLVIACESSILP